MKHEHASARRGSLSLRFRPHRARPQLESLEDRQLLSGTASLASGYGEVPLMFESNQGQTDAQAQFLARGPGTTVFLTSDGAVLRLQPSAGASGATQARAVESVLRMQLIGADPVPILVGLDPLSTRSNAMSGNDPSRWRVDLPNYGRVAASGVYPGVDLVYEGRQNQLEYDFIVAPGADPSVIRLKFQGASRQALDAQGNLVLSTPAGDVVQPAPTLYQRVDGVNHPVVGRYVLGTSGEVGFDIGAYDHSRPLTIDPVISYSTIFHASFGALGNGVAVDSSGNAYIVGATASTDFPTSNAIQPNPGGGGGDAFVAKLRPDGSVAFATYLGGSGYDYGSAIAVDSAGQVYVTGSTTSSDFPIYRALQSTYGGGTNGGDAFVTVLRSDGSALVYSTFLGGGNVDVGDGIAVDSSGSAYVTGWTISQDFPTVNALQPNHGGVFALSDAFVSKLGPGGSTLVYSTFLGGSWSDYGASIAVDQAGRAYVVGETGSSDFPTVAPVQQTLSGPNDAFVAELRADGSALVFSTFLGGGSYDFATGVVVDRLGSILVTGATNSSDFPIFKALQPVFGGDQDAFVTKFQAGSSSIVYSTYLGGQASDYSTGIAIDSSGEAVITGGTQSTNFPTSNAFQPIYGGVSDGFVARLLTDGSALSFGSYLGGSDWEVPSAVAVDESGNIYVTGYTYSTDFPKAVDVGPAPIDRTFGAFVSKIAPGPLENGPTVIAIQREGVHSQPTLLELTFSTYLDPSSAVDPANYRLLGLWIDGHWRPIRLKAIAYDPGARTVTLLPRQRLALRYTYVLVVRGNPPGGVTDTAGRLLDGNGDGVPGGNSVNRINHGTLVRTTHRPRASRPHHAFQRS